MDPFEKSTTVDPEVRAYISSLVNAVGGSSTYDSTYAVGDDAIAVLKDLQRWLRLYDEKTNRLDVKRCLAEANLVKNDLLEILALWPDDANENKHKARLALACFELLVPLTWPVVLDDEKATVNHHRHLPYLQLAQVGYKRAILHYEDAKILRTAVRIALPSMAQPRRERSRRDEGVIKLVLYLVCNIAMITQPQHLPSQGDENEVSRSATIEAFVTQDIFSALLTIGSGMGDEFQEQDVIVLEILFHLLKGVDARRLFMQKEQVTTEETQELKMLLQKEKAMLNSYNKHAPSRHHRFGTMLWVKRDDQKMSTVSGQMSITDEQTTLHQMDTSKKWNKPQYRGKLTKEFDENSDFGARIELTERAKRHLRQFVEDFLDSSFNPLFACLRRAIESQANRILETTHTKQYFYLMAWFLDAEAARREQAKISNLESGEREDHASSEDNTYAHIAAVLDQETFVLINRNMQKAFDDKLWQDLHATLLCFTQVLLTVQSMAESKDEEDQEIAENIQNRIFYEQSTHDRIVQVLRGYTHQGFAYLDAVTECVHVFVRMLERYSKQNVDLQVRQKRRSRKKQKQQNNENGAEDADEVADDMHEAQNTVSERKFDFARFSAKFLSQPCVDTFLSLIHFYRDLTPAQLKRAHRFFYRLAFKHELTVLLYRVDILQLFHKLIKGPEGLDPAVDGFRDWEQLIQQVFRRCIKWMEREQAGDGWKEAAVVEMLFSKVPGTVHYLQTGYERIVEKRPPRPPAELEVKPSVAEHQRIKVAATMMINLFKAHALDWTKKQIQDAIDERQAWEEGDAARKGPMDQNEDGAVGEPDPPPAFFIIPDNDERKSDLFKDKHLRLLFTTLGFQRLGMPEDVDAAWIIPPEITVSKLKEALEQIAATELNPLEDEEGRRVADCVRSKTSARRNATFPESASDSEDASGNGGVLDETLFPPNLPEKRRKRDADSADRQPPRKRVRRQEKTQEELEAQQKAKAVRDAEKNAKIKSKLFITDSDDESDEERDQAFFRLEEERRRKQEGNIRSALLKRLEESDDDDGLGRKGKASKSQRGRGKAAKQAVQRNISASEEDEEVGDTDGLRDTSPIELSDHNPSLSELSDNDSDEPGHADVDEGGVAEKHTPLTSPPPDTHSPAPRPLKEVSVNRASARLVDNDDDDDVPLIKPAARRNLRAGFIIDSDSE